eukprot:m.238404 g.238404  ORF g.238404 m.238404 type:complete len:1008 (+) comp13298_c0_seq1:69-3092(+)
MSERDPLLARGQPKHHQLQAPSETSVPINDLPWHEHEAEYVLDRFETSLDGLTEDTAKTLLQRYGRNCLTPPKQTSLPMLFAIQLISGFGILLWFAAVLCFIAWKPLGDPPDPLNLTLAICLVAVIVIQAFFNLYQEFSSRKVMEALAKMIPTSIDVSRGGRIITISPLTLVLGDIVCLRSGTLVPADIRLCRVDGMKIDASCLTGESDAIACIADICTGTDMEHANNMALFGTTVVDGQGIGVVIATGDRTRLGATVALATSTKPKPTPLQLEIRRFVLIIAALSLLTGGITFLVWYLHLRTAHPNFLPLSAMLVNVISLIVAYVPEGMPVAVTVTLRLVAQRMREQKLLVRSLTSVETLGSVNVIASDKTGTITMNQMTARTMIFGLRTYNLSEFGFNERLFLPIWRALCLCSGSSNVNHGDATDRALLRLYERFAPEGAVPACRAKHAELARIPFNSRNKYMVTVHHVGKSSVTVHMKGAFEMILGRCTTMLDSQGNEMPLAADRHAELNAAAKQLASEGKRVLSVARLELDPQKYPATYNFDAININFPIDGLCLLALFGLEDPPRPGVREAIEQCRTAGIRVFMVTGDHPETAVAISREITLITARSVDRMIDYRPTRSRGMLAPKSSSSINYEASFTDEIEETPVTALVVTGQELDALEEDDKETWDWMLNHKEIVFARTSPDQKLRIVQNLQARDQIVAATGDGVNDAAAIKCADVGLAMGSGTDAAKQAAGMILLDDSFASIVNGVQSGRTVFENLQKVILYLLPAGSWSEMLPVIANVFFGMPQPLSSFQMIMICMLTDIFPSMSMVYEPPEADIMHRPPRDVKKDRLVSWRFIAFAYGYIGMFESAVAFVMFFWYMSTRGFSVGDLLFAYDDWGNEGYRGYPTAYQQDSLNVGQSIFFLTLVIVQFGNALSIRTRRVSALPPHHPVNIYMLGGIGCSFAIAMFLVNIPIFNSAFNTAPVPYEYFLLPFAAAFVLMFWDELRKLAVRRAVPVLRHIWW